MTIARNDLLAKLPVSELNASLEQFLRPVTDLLPDPRLRPVTELMVRGIVTSQSPVVTRMARGASHLDARVWPTCMRGYRFLANSRFSYRTLCKGLYRVAQVTVATYRPTRLVIAIDPVNFEKPYTHQAEGVSTVMKSTPPGLKGEKRLTRGYPAITATLVNLPQIAISYAQWFSYLSPDFLSQNREIERAIRMSRAVFPEEKLRLVGDAGLDDQKVFAQVDRVQAEFVIRACHDRQIEVYNDRLKRWEPEALFDLVASVPFQFTRRVEFTHAGRTRRVLIQFGWFKVRLPETQQVLWVVVAHDSDRQHDLVLITNVPLNTARLVREVYTDWRQRSYVEHGYRFDQEQGLDVEDVRVSTLERMRRLFVLVRLAAQFVTQIDHHWPRAAVTWLRTLGGKLGLSTDRDGLYLLLRGISAVWQTVSTLTFVQHHPFPRKILTCV